MQNVAFLMKRLTLLFQGCAKGNFMKTSMLNNKILCPFTWKKLAIIFHHCGTVSSTPLYSNSCMNTVKISHDGVHKIVHLF